MNFFKTLLGWAGDAWKAITGAAGDVAGALQRMWHYITSVHNLLSWITGQPLLTLAKTILANTSGVAIALDVIRDVLRRLAAWIWATQVKPVRDYLLTLIIRLWAWTVNQLHQLHSLVLALYAAARAYTDHQVGAERAARIRAVDTEHKQMIARVAWALAQVQLEAAGGYNTGLHDRLSVIQRLLDDLGTRNPLVRGIIRDLVAGVLDLEGVENPLARWILARLLSRVISRLGVDRVAGDLVSRLLGVASAHPRAKNLYDVAKDVSARLDALENQWADFMVNGGPEVEQAGREWKGITDVASDVGLLAFVGLAVADPGGWAGGVADTIGAVADPALSAIVSVIGKV